MNHNFFGSEVSQAGQTRALEKNKFPQSTQKISINFNIYVLFKKNFNNIKIKNKK